MGDAEQIPSIDHAEAAQWNQALMLEFQATLEKNPAADLMSMFPDPYCREHRKTQRRGLSYAGNINLSAINSLKVTLKHDPEADLLAEFPIGYARRIKMATEGRTPPVETEEEKKARAPP